MIVKSPNIVCRLEERKHPAEKPAIEFINIFNPSGRFERRWFVDLDSRLNEVNDNPKRLIAALTNGEQVDD